MLGWLKSISKPKEPSAEDVLRLRAEAALADSFLSDDEWTGLKAAAAASGISEDRALTIYQGVAHGIVEARLLEALDDGMISPEEEQDLQFLGKDLRLALTYVPETQAIVDRAKRMWRLTHEDLPQVPAPLGLQRGEVCYAWVTAEALEQRQRTRAVSFAGPTVSIPIVKGVRYRMGRYNVGRETYQYSHSHGVGTLVVTNKRLIFVGDRSITGRLSSILDVEGYSDGVRITRTSGKPVTYLYRGAAEDFGVILARAWAEGR